MYLVVSDSILPLCGLSFLLPDKAEETEIVEKFLQEALMMKDFSHPHVLTLIGIALDDDGSPMAVLPFMANGDLRSYIINPELVSVHTGGGGGGGCWKETFQY